MQPIVIVGFGGLGREMALLINQINVVQPQWKIVGFLDDQVKEDPTSFNIPYLGPIEALRSLSEAVAIAVGIGTPAARGKVIAQINPGRFFPNLIHPTVVHSELNWQIGVGNLIASHCSFTTGIFIGNFNVFNTKITIGHDVVIGDYNVFNPTVCISGHVTIGNHNLFGVNSTVLQSRTIGSNNVLAAGSVLMSSMRDDEMWLGVPALKVE